MYDETIRNTWYGRRCKHARQHQFEQVLGNVNSGQMSIAFNNLIITHTLLTLAKVVELREKEVILFNL